jgi:Flp pilus assembly protein TadB
MIPAINVLFAVVFAAGVFAIVMGLVPRQERADLSVIERIGGKGQIRRGAVAELEHRLEMARVDIGVDDFIVTSLGLAFLGGALGFLLSGVLLAAVLGAVVGGIAYWVYLTSKAAQEIEAYEDALPQVLARLISGAQMGGTFEAAAAQAAEFGPAICRQDWAYIAAQRASGVKPDDIFDEVAARRGSLLLTMIFELIIIQQRQGVGLSQTLQQIEEALRERVKVARRARSAMKGPMRELIVVCAMPFLVVAGVRVVAPGAAAVYSTLVGQFIIFIAWGIVITAFIIGYRSFSQGLREETDFGVLPSEIRSEQQPEDEEPAAKSYLDNVLE